VQYGLLFTLVAHASLNLQETTMNFWIFLAGFAIVIAGVAWGLSVAGLSTTYILIACVILFGLGILTAVTRTRQKDPPA
jgi:hypothetical protein